MFLIFILISYLIGSIPVGFLLGKIKKIDIRNTGSGNIGATNIYRAFGKKYAIIVGLCDFLKGFIPTLIATQIFLNQEIIAAVALATVLGHIFPVFLKFKGGKGVATYSGTIMAILGIKLMLPLIILWLAFLYICKYMSLTNLSLSMVIPFIFLFLLGSNTYFAFSLASVVLIWFTHRSNIKRLTEKSEPKLRI